ncbi:MAG TPA: energy-coupling factor transporter transmembrane component T [Anaerolineales bacterium]|nr:energy-coupling factor transporter transmembrane component T [Anaerolineales bacterium]
MSTFKPALQRRRSRSFAPAIVESSPLRRVDPRAKLALGLCASLAVMLPLERMLSFIGLAVVFLAWARLLPAALQQVWRLKWVLLFLFLGDWLLVGLDLAILITLRLALLAAVMVLFFATTTSREFGLALEALHMPYRYAFSLSLSFTSLDMLREEWLAIQEAQQARGIQPPGGSLRRLIQNVRDFIAFTVPAVVLTTRHAWALTEAAYARGFDSPLRKPYLTLHFTLRDAVLLLGAFSITIFLFIWKSGGIQ